MTILAAVLLIVLIVFWVCFGGEMRETSAPVKRMLQEMDTASHLADKIQAGGPVVFPAGFVLANAGPNIDIKLPCGWTYTRFDWRSQQVGLGVSRCPSDPDNPMDHLAQ